MKEVKTTCDICEKVIKYDNEIFELIIKNDTKSFLNLDICDTCKDKVVNSYKTVFEKDIKIEKGVVQILNDLLAIDKEAITKLINFRVPCNAEMASHPNVQVLTEKNYSVGLLGILNGTHNIENGYICAMVNEDNIERFAITEEIKDTGTDIQNKGLDCMGR